MNIDNYTLVRVYPYHRPSGFACWKFDDELLTDSDVPFYVGTEEYEVIRTRWVHNSIFDTEYPNRMDVTGYTIHGERILDPEEYNRLYCFGQFDGGCYGIDM